ncbi:MAG: alpha-galactosidase [Bacilli bacterium]|nr:alpha-galactosidase [Bacilli bacterium]
MLTLTYLKDNQELKTNDSNQDLELIIKKDVNHTVVSVKALAEIKLVDAKLDTDIKIKDNDLMFLNGYQSWTDTAEVDLSFKERNVTKLPKFLVNAFGFDRYGDPLIYNYDKNKLHGYDCFYIRGEAEYFSYSLNVNKAYLVYEINKADKSLTLTSMCLNKKLASGEEFNLFDYLEFASIEEGINSLHQTYPHRECEKVFGYTSWYNYYQNINEEIILRDLEGLDSRFNLFQIDDGYETYVGDWKDIDPAKFPNGLADIVNKIHQKGYKAGIWLAPFVAETKSKLFSERKDLLKMVDGTPVSCGGNWSGFYALDMQNPDTLAYIKECLEYYIDLGFDFFKLDFLYAASLPLYEGLTRAEMAEKSYAFIKEVLKDKLVLGCGAIPFNSANKFEYLRIGPDVSLIFDDIWYMKHMHRERISTKVTLQNTIYRSIFNNHLFLNDPDVFLLRDDNIKLSAKQKEALLTINSLFGSVLMTSDNIGSYDDAKKDLLEKAFEMFYQSTDKSYKKDGNYILISYKLEGKVYNLKYNTLKGVME